MGIFHHRVVVNMQDTDAAGILFFSRQFEFAHETYEMFLESIGFSFADALENESFLLPIVHAESDYLRSLKVGDKLDVELTVARLGSTSFNLEYLIKRNGEEVVGRTRTVHVAITRADGKKTPLPGKLREALERFQKA